MTKEIIQIQIAWFLSSIYNRSFEDFSLKLKNKLGESKTTQLLPIPNDMPDELPRLILGYEKFNVHVAKNRLDIFLKDTEVEKEIFTLVNDVIIDELELHVNRLGLVKNFFAEGSIAQLMKLLQVSNEEENFKEISIRINQNKKIQGYESNNIENLSIGKIIKKEEGKADVTKQGILLVRDINNVINAGHASNLSKEQIVALKDAFNLESNTFILANWE